MAAKKSSPSQSAGHGAQGTKAAATPIAASPFRAWRERLGLSQRKAAAALDYDIRSIKRFDAGTAKITRTLEIAMAALEALLPAPPASPKPKKPKTKSPKTKPSPPTDYAVYDTQAIWGLGESVKDAVIDAIKNIDPMRPLAERLAKLKDMEVAPATKRLTRAINEKGGNIAFVKLRDGRLDLPDEDGKQQERSAVIRKRLAESGLYD